MLTTNPLWISRFLVAKLGIPIWGSAAPSAPAGFFCPAPPRFGTGQRMTRTGETGSGGALCILGTVGHVVGRDGTVCLLVEKAQWQLRSRLIIVFKLIIVVKKVQGGALNLLGMDQWKN